MKKSVFVFAIAILSLFSIQTIGQVKDSTKKDTARTDTVKKDTLQKKNPSSGAGDIVQAISGSGYNTILSSALKESGTAESLKSNEKYTIFAPNDKAFSENKTRTDSVFANDLAEQKVIKNHIVKGEYTKSDIIKALSANKGSTELTTIDGEKLILKVNNQNHLEISDEEGHTAEVTVFDLKGTNGVAHVVDGILLAK